jgi:basic membrane lipoprotein Med (substrate-binding protein (PBP1-ABC) superfamily)
MKVALITPGPVSDKGWSASAFDGVKRIEKELGATLTPPVEGPEPASVAGELRRLAQAGNHLIFVHASEYDDAAKQVAADFPKTTFVVVGGRSAGRNLTPLQFQSGEANYLVGMLAGGMTKTGKIGAVGASEIPIVKAGFDAFARGAKAARPDANVSITWTGNESDLGKARQTAQALLDGGADVLTHNANAGGQGVFQAVTQKPGAMVIGANADQSGLAPAQTIASFVLSVPDAYLSIGRTVKEGKGTGQPFRLGLKENAVGVAYNSRFQGAVPGDLKAKVEQARQDIIDGKLDPSK